MTRTAYTATLADGTVISRNSTREYSHAWAVTYQGRTASGFAASEALARASANAYANMLTSRRDFNACKNPRADFRWVATCYKEEGGEAAWNARIIERERQCKIEIVSVEVN